MKRLLATLAIVTLSFSMNVSALEGTNKPFPDQVIDIKGKLIIKNGKASLTINPVFGLDIGESIPLEDESCSLRPFLIKNKQGEVEVKNGHAII